MDIRLRNVCHYTGVGMAMTPYSYLLCRHSASIADEMDGEDVRRKVHISSVPQRVSSPDQQIEVKITTKKAAAYPGDSTTRT